MTKPAPFTQASLKRAIFAAQKAGLHVVGIRPDGTVLTSEVENPNSAVSLVPQQRQDADASRWGDE
jgi:hypothetical protein